MSWSQGELTAAAGVDPWALAQSVQSGDPAQVAELAAAFSTAGGQVAEAASESARARSYLADGYHSNGMAPAEMSQVAARTRTALADQADHLPLIARTLDAVAGDLDTVIQRSRREIGALESELAGVASAWNSFASSTGQRLPPDDLASIESSYFQRAVSAVRSHGGTLSTAVEGYETTLTAATRRLADLGYLPPLSLDDGPQTPASLPPAASTPIQVAAWWDALTTDQQRWLVEHQSSAVGNLDGVPALARDAANREAAPQLSAQLDQQIATLRGQEPAQWIGVGSRFPRPNPAWTEWHDQVDALTAHRDGIGAVQTELGGRDPGDPPLYLLGLDTAGHAIIATGDPDTATDVATFVTGVGTHLSGIGGDVGRSDTMYNAAQLAGSTSTSVITWYGYDAPQSLSDGIDNSYAEHAAGSLDSFQSGLDATHTGAPAHTTVIGHSYGTTVVGQSAAHGNELDTDDVVLLASPGATVDHATDLHLTGVPSDQDPQHVYASTAQYDPINLAGGVNGPSPTSLSFGARTFTSSSTPGPWYEFGWNMSAHSGYWDRSNAAVANLGLVIAGHGGEVR